MIIRGTHGGDPEILEADDLTSLHVELEAGQELGQLGIVRDGHAWLTITSLQTAGSAVATGADWATEFDAMISYASSKGWLDPEAGAVRAHIEQP